MERCSALFLVVDLSSQATAFSQLRALRAELRAYSATLADRPCRVVGTKLDVPGARRALAALGRSKAVAALGGAIGVSSHSGEGLEELRAAVLALKRSAQAAGA